MLIEKISLRPELSSPAYFRFQGGPLSITMDGGRTEILVSNIGFQLTQPSQIQVKIWPSLLTHGHNLLAVLSFCETPVFQPLLWSRLGISQALPNVAFKAHWRVFSRKYILQFKGSGVSQSAQIVKPFFWSSIHKYFLCIINLWITTTGLPNWWPWYNLVQVSRQTTYNQSEINPSLATVSAEYDTKSYCRPTMFLLLLLLLLQASSGHLHWILKLFPTKTCFSWREFKDFQNWDDNICIVWWIWRKRKKQKRKKMLIY